jgi:5'-3' exonuclease
MVALIDADSIIYIIGWAHREDKRSDLGMTELVQEKCKSMLQYILTTTRATHYLGSFSSSKSFRNEEYKVAPYKGTRPDKPDWVIEWQDVIKCYFVEELGFIIPVNLEADDIMSMAAEILASNGDEFIVCSPDKDLRQIAGNHFDYKKNELISIRQSESVINFWSQMLTGDSTDNVIGIPGIGEVKAKAILTAPGDQDSEERVVRSYQKYYGIHYGDIIYIQTYNTLRLITKKHPLFDSDMASEYSLLDKDINDAPNFTTELDKDLFELGW